jgi:serine/threonine-protein kinase
VIGSRLGPYEITAKLGEGGMGEVYRATDSRLDREVAIKVLPLAFLEDEDRLARFEREARLLAQLHHPNIASIHGLEEAEGARALVMELVEGPTLAERLEPGALPLEETLGIARQIAEALEEAHEKGIIHRDLKPQNVKVTADGRVKVLDFGLAKAMDPVGGASGAGSASQLAASPTLTLGATVQGVILGTAAYMAPEQAAGAAVDRRADIWSFGVVLYEMLSGRRLFEGETVSHVLASVLKEEPDFSLLPDEVPPRIRRLLRRCLRKKPRERLQAIGDARLVIDEVLAGTTDEAPAAISEPAASPRRPPWPLLGAAGLAALAVGLLAGRSLLAPRAEPALPLRVELAFPAGQMLHEADGHPAIALSADGRRIALAVWGGEDRSRSGIVWRDLGRLEWQRLDGSEAARAPFFSPDGEWLGFFADTDLVKVPLAGGRPIRLAAADFRSRGAVWGRDGFIYFSQGTNHPIERIPDSGGAAEPVTQLDAAREERTHRWPELTPDGSALLFTSDTAASPTFYDDARIEAVRLATGERHVVVEKASMARMLADDLLVYANAGNLFAVAVDPRTLVPVGRPVALEQEVATNVGSGSVNFAISRAGAAVWVGGDLRSAVGAPLWFARDGSTTPSELQVSVDVLQLALSPDGRRVALRGGDVRAGVGQDLWVGDLERGTVSRLTFDENADHPVWSPDGQRIAYLRTLRPAGVANPAGGSEIAWKLADGSGETEVLVGAGAGAPQAFSPDGSQLVLARWTDASLLDLMIVDVDPPGEPRPLVATPQEEYAATISPDGRWIAYSASGSGTFEVFVQPFPAGTGKWQISAASGFEPRWSADGRELFFRNEGGRLYRVAVDGRGEQFQASTPELLFEGLLGGRNPRSYGVSSDGRRFLSLRLFEGARASEAVNFSDEWPARARRLLAPRQ